MMCFVFNDTATTEIYTLSLHDALPIYEQVVVRAGLGVGEVDNPERRRGEVLRLHHYQGPEELVPVPDEGQDAEGDEGRDRRRQDRKSTRLNSSHANISYAVFCLKKKKK